MPQKTSRAIRSRILREDSHLNYCDGTFCLPRLLELQDEPLTHGRIRVVASGHPVNGNICKAPNRNSNEEIRP